MDLSGLSDKVVNRVAIVTAPTKERANTASRRLSQRRRPPWINLKKTRGIRRITSRRKRFGRQTFRDQSRSAMGGGEGEESEG